jgi:hypothetical protein
MGWLMSLYVTITYLIEVIVIFWLFSFARPQYRELVNDMSPYLYLWITTIFVVFGTWLIHGVYLHRALPRLWWLGGMMAHYVS